MHRTIIKYAVSAALISAALLPVHAASCCGGKAGGGPRVGAFTGNVMLASEFLGNPHDDTLEFLTAVNGYYGNSWSPDGHSGDPLGTGGKWPLTYSMNLYRLQSVEAPAQQKRDLREQYVDFGYIPLWRANMLSLYGKYRLSPSLRAQAQVVYGGEPGKPGTNANGAIGIGEVSLLWVPFDIPNFWLKAGNILDFGTYSSLFDQNPLENFLFTGATASFAATMGTGIKSVTTFAFGGAFQNSTYLRDNDNSSPFPAEYLRAARQRTFAYAKTSFLFSDKMGIKLMGGAQFMPEDSTPDNLGAYVRYQKSLGGMGGMEATWFGRKLSHTLAVSYARGGAANGWGSPDYVLTPNRDPVDPSRSGQFGFTNEGSSCVNAVYWNGFEFENFHLSTGCWYNGRFPVKTAMTAVNPTVDSIRRLLPQNVFHDSVAMLRPRDFHAFKFAIFPSFQVGFTPLVIGVRYDNIMYLTPDAHTNTLEPARDQTLRPIAYPGGIEGAGVYAPARWDREAVNASVITPVVRLDFKELGGISCACAIGMYDKPVDRQGRIARVHMNLTIGADISITIKKTGWLKT